MLADRDCKRVMALVSRSVFAERNRFALQLSLLAGVRVGEIAALSVGEVLDSDGGARSDSIYTCRRSEPLFPDSFRGLPLRVSHC